MIQTTDNAIVISDVSRLFGKTKAIDHVSLKIGRTELFGILGPDGAGKTTLLRMMAAVLDPSDPDQAGPFGRISGMFHPPTGHLSVAGFDTVKHAEQVKGRLGYMPQAFGLYGDLSVDENLIFAADVFNVTGAAREQRIKELLDFAGLEQFRGRRAELLSGGMKKKLALACALLHRPEVLLLDEPTTGVDPVARREFWDLLSGLHGQGITTVVSTPYMDEAERCNRIVMLYGGRVLAEGTPQQIKSQIPGTVLAIKNVDIRAAQKILTDIAGVIDIQTYGDQLNLIVEGDTANIEEAIRIRAGQAGLSGMVFETMTVRMEEAFIYLVNEAKNATRKEVIR